MNTRWDRYVLRALYSPVLRELHAWWRDWRNWRRWKATL